ncbi:hypothetical protein EPUS_03641 [Endocarpon pusillum Z07020]|uniref:Uncharacterized protein n=1 Tax=Endocarpon pusillum (strain Z07020 / HMAS-L-300199) TaxID=1263415 RepID=U1HL20_ENDPU|nr:uncharacterized protein EPUS_03641 [Endocarpon pusillum Z07020]ERF69649.1 hypothetical protein EPUS_03641 [Endocarpon pusillum Z07020]
MPSSIHFTTPAESKTRSSSIYTRPPKKQKMSITQTYFLAHSARGKLSKEASRADHDLRLLVGHANLLDSLMLDLASAEQEQEQWFAKSLSQSEESVEEPKADWEAEDADESESESDSEYDEDAEMIEATTQAPNVTVTEVNEEDADFEEDDEEDYGDLALTRTASRHSPPELSSDSESDSEDEPMPPSPPSTTFDAFTEHQRQAIGNPQKDASLSESQQEAFIEEGFFLPSRSQQLQEPQPSMIAAC